MLQLLPVVFSFALAIRSRHDARCFALTPTGHWSRLYSTFDAGDIETLPEVSCLLGRAASKSPITHVERVSAEGAFCNCVYQLEDEKGRRMFAKVFSDLALRRMNPSRKIGDLDSVIAGYGLSPRVLATSLNGILTAFCEGAPLTEEDLCQRDSKVECELIGDALGHLHCIELGRQQGRSDNMLWRSCETMLSMSNPDLCFDGWNVDRLELVIKRHKAELEHERVPVVAVGHGDFKPANVLVDRQSAQVHFIDLELAGVHYRAYDVAKFFRVDKEGVWLERNRRAFYESYAACTLGDVDLVALKVEVQRMLPLTWLEAAIFFVCMASQAPAAQVPRWSHLACDRLHNYEISLKSGE